MEPDHHPIPRLILLGGENLTEESEPLWAEIVTLFAAMPARMLLIPAASYGLKSAKTDYRLNRLTERLAVLGFTCERLLSALDDPDSRETGDPLAAFPDPRGLVLTMGECIRALESLSATSLWGAILNRWEEGWPLIASPGPAIALGQHAFQPIPIKDGLPAHFEYLTGLDLLTECAVVPHFDQLEPSVFSTLSLIFPPDARLICIDERAALFIEGDECRALGAGSVTIRDPFHALRVLRQGDCLSFTDLLI